MIGAQGIRRGCRVLLRKAVGAKPRSSSTLHRHRFFSVPCTTRHRCPRDSARRLHARFWSPQSAQHAVLFSSSATPTPSTKSDETEPEPNQSPKTAEPQPTVKPITNAAPSLLTDALYSATGCFAGIGSLSAIHYAVADGSPYTLVLGSMGATAVLVFGAPAAPFSQPWNVIAGHLVSAACGIAAFQFVALPMGTPALALPIAAAASVFCMKVGKCVHPPAGGTTLIAVLGSAQLHALG